MLAPSSLSVGVGKDSVNGIWHFEAFLASLENSFTTVQKLFHAGCNVL